MTPSDTTERNLHVVAALHALRGDRLQDLGCFLSGGAAAVLQLKDYRPCERLQFVCAAGEGFRQLRAAAVHAPSSLLNSDAATLSQVICDRHGLRAEIRIGRTVIPLEVFIEWRMGVEGPGGHIAGVPVIARDGLYAERLLCLADEASGSKRQTAGIDLAMMIEAWGPIPGAAMAEARAAYGHVIDAALHDLVARAAADVLPVPGIDSDLKARVQLSLASALA